MTALQSSSAAVSMMSAALGYASVGMRVFPVCPLHKRPLVTNNLAAATTNQDQIKCWWLKWPTAMIGFPTGALDGVSGGVIVVDVDSSSGGFETLAALEKKLGPLPRSLVAHTPSGGLHIWLNWQQGVRIKSLVGKYGLGPGIDVRGCLSDGTSKGYVVAAPSSRADGKAYRWATGVSFPLICDEPGEIPLAWLFALAFSAAERCQLAKYEIIGPESFAGISPSDWQSVAHEKLASAWRKIASVPEGPLALDASQRLQSYIEASIESELVSVREAFPGIQETTASAAALKLHGLIKGAAVCGHDTHKLESEIAKRFCAAVVTMLPGDVTKPWTAAHAGDKWERTAEAAEPRNLFHVVRKQSAEEQFADIRLPAPGGQQPGRVLEFPSDISIDDIIERQSRALVKGLLHPGETAMLYGQSGAGKSFIALDLAWHIALGIEWHGNRVKQASVLYVCLEGVDGFRKRIIAYGKAIGDSGKQFARLAIRVALVKADAGKQGVDKIVAAAKELSDQSGSSTCLIVIDTLARAMAGDDENATSDMMHFVEQRAGAIAWSTGSAVLIIHHTNAAGSARGSGALWAGCDAVLRADRDGEKRTLSAEKVKDGAERSLFNYTLEDVPLGIEDDGSAISSCVVRTTPADRPRTPKPKDKRVPKPLRVFREAFNALESAQLETVGTAHKLSLADVRAGFYSRYSTGDADPETARNTKAHGWQRGVELASQSFEIRDEQVWRRSVPATEACNDTFGDRSQP